MVARTKRGSSSGSAASSQDGVHGRFWRVNDGAHGIVGVVGGPSPEFKKLGR